MARTAKFTDIAIDNSEIIKLKKDLARYGQKDVLKVLSKFHREIAKEQLSDIRPLARKQPVPLANKSAMGFTASGTSVHVQNVSINTDFSREDINELGRKNPYYRPAAFPVEVTCEIEAVTTSGDFITALEDGDPALNATPASGNNTSEENIHFVLRGGYSFDLGKKNRLSSVSYGGGDATGGNVSCTYSYTL